MAPFAGTFFSGACTCAQKRGRRSYTQVHTRVHAIKFQGKIKSNVDISSAPMLDMFIEDLPGHTIFLSPLLSVVLRTLDRGGGIRRHRLGTSGSGSWLGPSGDQIGHF